MHFMEPKTQAGIFLPPEPGFFNDGEAVRVSHDRISAASLVFKTFLLSCEYIYDR